MKQDFLNQGHGIDHLQQRMAYDRGQYGAAIQVFAKRKWRGVPDAWKNFIAGVIVGTLLAGWLVNYLAGG